MSICARVVVAVDFQQVDSTPDAKTSTQCDDESLKNGYCAVEKCHKCVLPCTMRPCGRMNSDFPSACAPANGQTLFCCQQRTHDIFVTGTNLLGMICVNHFVLITGLEFQPMVEKRLDAEHVFLIGTSSEPVVRMLGQIVFI